MEDRTDNVLTIGELSAYLKISRSTLYKLAQERRVPGRKVGRHWRFHKDVVDQWLGKTAVAAGRSVKTKKAER